MGSISGSAIANVVTSGAFTIPLMKRLGYTREEAGGVEAAASTGGQIMPPIMGAGAFLMAEYTGLPYADIVRLSILPAFLYFATVLPLRRHHRGEARDARDLRRRAAPAGPSVEATAGTTWCRSRS
jgi:TRAP-type uncharacterized transport system fused permease subunit